MTNNQIAHSEIPNLIPQLKEWLILNLPTYSAIPLRIIAITDQSEATDDPGNELLLLALIMPEDEDETYTEHEPIINIRGLNNAFNSSDFADGDHAITIEPYIGLNSTILLPITFLK